MSRDSLGSFELMVLLAVLRVGDEAYGVPIAKAIETSTGRDVILASVYNALDRLKEKGLVTSALGEPTCERGGRAKKYFQVTAKGVREVTSAKTALNRLWQGIPQLKGATR
jgi:DNA-binding PadR family transcriptional regulator